MKKTIQAMKISLAAVVALVQFSGCFAYIGYQVGKAIDENKKVEKRELGSLDQGNLVTVQTQDYAAISGRYRGLVRIPADSYTRTYDAARKKNEFGFLLPDMGETIFVVDHEGGRREVKFRGFGMKGRNGDRVKPVPQSGKAQALDHYYISFSDNGDSDESLMYLSDVKRIAGADGDVVEASSIREMMYRGEIPVRTAVALDTGNGLRFVGLDDVDRVTASGPKYSGNARWVGTTIGLVLDAAAIGLAVYGLSQVDLDWDWGSSNDSSSYNDNCSDGDPYNDYLCGCDVTSPGSVQSLLFLVLVFALLLRRAKAYSRSR